MIYKLITGIADVKTRNRYAQELAKHLHFSHLLIFIKDSHVNLLLPAHGFPQTMHIDKEWLHFFTETKDQSVYHGEIPYYDNQEKVNATGVSYRDEAVAIFINGYSEQPEFQIFVDLFPLLATSLLLEQRTLTAETKSLFAEKAAEKAEHLTKTIDSMRHMLKDALVTQEQHKKEIEELLRKKDDFINIASHELKTPMTSLKAYMQLLQRGNISTSPQLIATNSLKQIVRLEGIIGDMLQVSKLKNGKLIYQMRVIDFSEIIEETVSSLQVISPNHQLIIRNNLNSLIFGDKNRLEQVLTNYITNAIKYSPQSNRVIIDSIIEDQQLIVSVKDFGIGIEKEHLNNLFERFYRADNTAMKYEGLGLGLYIASEIITQHGGNFWIESEVNKGSTFYFKLPLNSVPLHVDYPVTENEYHTDFIDIKIDDSLQIVEVNWKGYNNMNTIKEGCMKIIEFLKSKKISKVLNSNKDVLGTWSDASEWVGKQWFPLAELAGLTHFGWVNSNATFSQLSAQKSDEFNTGSVITKFFDNDNAAKEWLTSL
jgi:signal transduction histidine kinase